MPAVAGIGLRSPHHAAFREHRPAIGWLEVHAENFFAPAGPSTRLLESLRADYPLSLHGVGLSLGSTDPLDESHLCAWQHALDRFQPQLISEHLCWVGVGGRYLNDLLPLPYTDEALDHVAARIDAVQERFRRTLAIENLSSYVEFEQSTLAEAQFLAELVARTGCALLVDINNIHVSARNHGTDPHEFLATLPRHAVAEIHLAGHTRNVVDGREILIDSHSDRVAAPVWSLYEAALGLFGPVPTLIEWDRDIPTLDVLLDEAAMANQRLETAHARAA